MQSQNLAASFPAKNGFPIDDPRSLYDEDNPYDCERDNRFFANQQINARINTRYATA